MLTNRVSVRRRHRMIFCTQIFTNYYAVVLLLAPLVAVAATGCAPEAPASARADGPVAPEEPAAPETSGAPEDPVTREDPVASEIPAAQAATAEGPARGAAAIPPPARYAAARDAHIEALVSEMTLVEKVGQLLIAHLASPQTGRALTELGPEMKALLGDVRPGGVVLYGGNIEDVEQLTSLIGAVRAASELAPFVAVDEEGGLVSRLTHLGSGEATRLPPAADIGAAGDALLAYRAGRALGRELRSLGFNLNFAPVVDVAEPGANPFLETRTFSGDPEEVTRLAVPFLRGLQNHGVSAGVKHFPGHGTAEEDSHYGPATVTASREELARNDWMPFHRAIEADTDAVMVAHLAVPSLTESNTPASIAPEVIDVARTELGFEGLLISDAVVMDGLSQVLDGRSPAVAVVEAGADVVLAPADPFAAREALLSAVESGRIAEERINASVRRILRIKLDRGILVPEGEVFDRRFRHVRGLDPKQVLAAPEHVTLVQTIMTRAAEARGAVAAP